MIVRNTSQRNISLVLGHTGSGAPERMNIPVSGDKGQVEFADGLWRKFAKLADVYVESGSLVILEGVVTTPEEDESALADKVAAAKVVLAEAGIEVKSDEQAEFEKNVLEEAEAELGALKPLTEAKPTVTEAKPATKGK